MASQQMDSQQYDAGPGEKKGMGGCLKFFLIAFGIGAVLAVGGIWWLSNNWQGLLVGGGLGAIEAGVDKSDLPDAEKVELKAELQRLQDGFDAGTISGEQMLNVAQGLAQSPLMSMFVVSAMETGYVQKSGLSDEEKITAKVTLDRMANGLVTEKISRKELEDVMTHISDRDANGTMQIREKVTDEELRKFLTAAAEKADAAGVPAEIEPIDPSDELKKIIDAALSGKDPLVEEDAADENMDEQNADEEPMNVQDAA